MSYELNSSLDIMSAVKGMNNFARVSLTQTSIVSSIMTSKTTKTTTKTKKV